MSKVRIEQIKSAIDKPFRQKRTLRALGIKKMRQVVEVEATPQIMGMVHSINHLLSVQHL